MFGKMTFGKKLGVNCAQNTENLDQDDTYRLSQKKLLIKCSS